MSLKFYVICEMTISMARVWARQSVTSTNHDPPSWKGELQDSMVRVMAWRRAGDEPLPQPKVVHLLTCRFIHNRPLMRLMTYIGNIDSNWGWNRNMPYNKNKNGVPLFRDPFYPISPAVDTTWFAHEARCVVPFARNVVVSENCIILNYWSSFTFMSYFI